MNTRHIIFPSNRFHDIEATYHHILAPLYDQGEVRTFLLMLAEKYLNWDTAAYLLHRHDTIDQSVLLQFHWALKDLQQQRPVQHIIGSTTFCGSTIAVSPAVLIPRPETEEMVLHLVRHLHAISFDPRTILDLCTGSGCIAIALKKAFPTAAVAAVDISAAALEVARSNAKRNAADIAFLQADILDQTIWDKVTRDSRPPAPASQDREAETPCFDIIISNPPYVRDSERKGMRRNVLDYEPALALFVDDSDPLIFYRNIAAFALRRLSSPGILVLEINEHLAQQTQQLLRAHSLSPTLCPDFAGKPRSIFCKKDTK